MADRDGFRDFLRSLPEAVAACADAGLPVVFEVDREPAAHVRRPMDALGVEIVSVEQVETRCPHEGCGWNFVGAASVGKARVPDHLKRMHGGRYPHVNGAGAGERAKAHVEVIVASEAVERPEPAVREAAEVRLGPDADASATVQHPRVVAALAAMRRFHDEHGRWPLPSEGVEGLPHRTGSVVGLSWRDLWQIVGAGKIPTGRAAQTYKRSGHGSPLDASPSETGSATPVEAAGNGSTSHELAPAPGESAPEIARTAGVLREPLPNASLPFDADLLADEASYLRRRALALEQLASGARQLMEAG